MTSDPGSVAFDVHLDRGVVRVTVRSPLALPSSAVSAELPIADVLDVFADLVKGLNQVQRDAIRQRRTGIVAHAPGQ